MNLKQMREEFARLHKEAEDFLTTFAEKEPTADEAKAQEERFAKLEKLKQQIDAKERLAGLSFARAAAATIVAGASAIAGAAQLPTEGQEALDLNRSGFSWTMTSPEPMQTQERRDFAQAVSEWGGTGIMREQFATITTATNSGILLPRSVVEPSVPTSTNAFREAFAAHGMQPLTTSDTAPINWPVFTAAKGGTVSETANAETENAPSTAQSIILTPSTYESGSAWFSNLQLRAVSFDLLQAILPSLIYSKELKLEDAIAAAIIADANITQSVATASVSSLTYDNLADLDEALPKQYGKQKFIILSAAAYKAAKKLVGTDGHPVLLKDPQNDTFLRFNGTPVFRCDNFEAFGANKIVGMIGSLLGFKLRDCVPQELQRYVSQPGRPAQTGLNLFGFHAFGWSPLAMAKLKCPAS